MAVKSLAQSSILQPSGVNSLLGDYESNYFHHLETVRLGGSAASVTFSNLAQYSDYQHLQIRSVAKASSTANDYWAIGARFNSDSNTNYYHHQLLGNGSNVTSSSNSQSFVYAGLVTNNYSTNPYGVGTLDILDAFETTKNKNARALMGVTGGFNRLFFTSGLWLSQSAINSITLIHNNGDSFIAGSRFSLYGIKVRS